MKTCFIGNVPGFPTLIQARSVCKNKRSPRQKVFDWIAQRGKFTMDYFFGFKSHYVINDKGEIFFFALNSGNTDDREPEKIKYL